MNLNLDDRDEPIHSSLAPSLAALKGGDSVWLLSVSADGVRLRRPRTIVRATPTLLTLTGPGRSVYRRSTGWHAQRDGIAIIPDDEAGRTVVEHIEHAIEESLKAEADEAEANRMRAATALSKMTPEQIRVALPADLLEWHGRSLRER